ncbi:glycosyltransferase [Flavobacterium ovatum]|uniref:glycosyltransferase n=1 Tax=Flavobacterium ovatum TaxID=1928857 RepID=UPI00344C51C5
MKILHVISSMHPNSGGTSQAIRNIIPSLQKNDVENEVVCLDNSDLDYGATDDFKIYKIGRGKTSYQYQSLLVKWLENNLLTYGAVIVHGIWQYPNYAVYRAISRLKTQNKLVPKVVIMPHGMLDPYFQKATDRKWKALRNELVWKATEQKAVNAADALFFTCEEELLLAQTTFKGYDPKKEINVGFGIPHPPIRTVRMQTVFHEVLPSLKNNYWLFLSRIHPKKGIDLLIEAYSQLCLEHPILPELVIAGPTDSVYAQQMMTLAKNNPKIHFTGMLNGEAKWGAFYGCDTYLLPSHQENFGISIVEAMACRKSVLISKNINIWREIEAGNGGWVLDNLTVKAIEAQLVKIAKLDILELELKDAQAYDTFEQKFSIEVCAAVFTKVIKEL